MLWIPRRQNLPSEASSIGGSIVVCRSHSLETIDESAPHLPGGFVEFTLFLDDPRQTGRNEPSEPR